MITLRFIQLEVTSDPDDPQAPARITTVAIESIRAVYKLVSATERYAPRCRVVVHLDKMLEWNVAVSYDEMIKLLSSANGSQARCVCGCFLFDHHDGAPCSHSMCHRFTPSPSAQVF